MATMRMTACSPAAAGATGASAKAAAGLARPSLVRNLLQMRSSPNTDRSRGKFALRAAVDVGTAGASVNAPSPDDPLLLRAARGEKVERAPVWMMRQAGRYMKIYQDLCKKPGSTTFRERSENVDLVVEISLQPWKAFGPDGVILFSDILTPLSGMNIPFDIVKAKGPIIHDPITTMEGVREVQRLVPEESVPYVGASLKQLRKEVGNQATVLGFVGAPFTLASYIVEGGTSYTFSKIKSLAFNNPEVLHALLAKLTESVTDYCRYQADSGAQTIQIFDSWASYLSPQDFEIFCLPYIKSIVADVRATHPHVPLIVYASGSAGLMTRLAEAEPDILSLDMSVQMGEARSVLGPEMGVQGNMDPGVLFGTKELIEARTLECIRAAGGHKHIMNLGHGVMVGTPEENVAHFFEVAKTANDR